MTAKTHTRGSSSDNDVLVNVARTIGSALGTVAAKITPAPKVVRRRRKAVKKAVRKVVAKGKKAAAAGKRSLKRRK